MKPRPFPFLALHLEGRKVKLLHEIGRCAIAQVWDEVGGTPYYLIRYREHYRRAATSPALAAAFAELRAREVEHSLQESELLTYELALSTKPEPPHQPFKAACLDAFCTEHGLDPNRAYTRQQVRNAIVGHRTKLTGHYLSLLNQLSTH